MKHNIRFEQNGLFVTITASGDPTYLGFERCLNELLDNPAWKPGMSVLDDFRELNIKKLNGKDIRENVRLHKQYIERIGSSWIAVVVTSRVEFGLMRMWEILAENSFPQHRVFYTTDDALIWLSQEGAVA